MKKANKRLTAKQKAAESRYRARVCAARADAEEKYFKAEDRTYAAFDYVDRQLHLNKLRMERKRTAAFVVYDGPPTAGAGDFSTSMMYMTDNLNGVFATRSVVMQLAIRKAKSAYEKRYNDLKDHRSWLSQQLEKKEKKINLALFATLIRLKKYRSRRRSR